MGGAEAERLVASPPSPSDDAPPPSHPPATPPRPAAPAPADKGASFFADPRFVRHLCAVFTPRFVAYIGFGMHLIKGVLAGGGSSGMLLTQRNIYVVKSIAARVRTLNT
eukprot:COSAG04_NODE_20_length_39202_cov_9.993530_18_plen_109_part_00